MVEQRAEIGPQPDDIHLFACTHFEGGIARALTQGTLLVSANISRWSSLDPMASSGHR